LGRLAKWLRILGFDALYFIQPNPGSLIIQALREERVILTRNQRFGGRAGVRIICLQAERVKEQIQEVFRKCSLQPDPAKMFSRCILCNQELIGIDKEKVKEQVPEYVFNTQERFITCPQCKRIYWQGTHWGNVKSVIEEIV